MIMINVVANAPKISDIINHHNLNCNNIVNIYSYIVFIKFIVSILISRVM